MKILSASESKRWLRSNEIEHDQHGHPQTGDLRNRFDLPTDAGQRVALVAKEMEPFRSASRFFVLLGDWGVWPSGQRMHVFERFRLSYGDHRPLIEAPGHEFRGADIEDALSLVTIAVLFLWDCHVVTRRRARQLYFSHDEFGLSSQRSDL